QRAVAEALGPRRAQARVKWPGRSAQAHGLGLAHDWAWSHAATSRQVLEPVTRRLRPNRRERCDAVITHEPCDSTPKTAPRPARPRATRSPKARIPVCTRTNSTLYRARP